MTVTTKKRLGAPRPSHPAKYEEADLHAIQALAKGTANVGQQKRALEWILLDVCGIRDLSYWEGGHEAERDTTFAEGKRFVGLQIAKLMNLRPKVTAQRTTNDGVPIGNEPED